MSVGRHLSKEVSFSNMVQQFRYNFKHACVYLRILIQLVSAMQVLFLPASIICLQVPRHARLP